MHHAVRIDEAPGSGPRRAAGGGDAGYTLIELTIVVLILAVLTSVVVVAVGGVTTEAAGTGCAADLRRLHTAVEAYTAQIGDTIPPSGVGSDRYERTLVTVGLLRAPSSFYDVDATGVVTTQGDSPC